MALCSVPVVPVDLLLAHKVTASFTARPRSMALMGAERGAGVQQLSAAGGSRGRYEGKSKPSLSLSQRAASEMGACG